MLPDAAVPAGVEVGVSQLCKGFACSQGIAALVDGVASGIGGGVVGMVDAALGLPTYQPADVTVAADRATGIGMTDLAVVAALVAHQPADFTVATDLSAGIGVADDAAAAALLAYQPANINAG